MPEISVKSYIKFFGSWTFFKGGVGPLADDRGGEDWVEEL